MDRPTTTVSASASASTSRTARPTAPDVMSAWVRSESARAFTREPRVRSTEPIWKLISFFMAPYQSSALAESVASELLLACAVEIACNSSEFAW